MHIAFLTPEFPHKEVQHSAGLGTSVYNMALGLINSGVSVSLFIYGQKTDKIIEYKGIKIYLICNKKYLLLGWYFHRKYIQKKINKVISKENIDILEAADWTGITAFMNFKIPLVIRIHGSDAFFCNLDKRKQKWKNYFFEKKAISKADALVSVSRFAADKTSEIFALKKHISTIPNAINLSNFNNATPSVYNKNTILYYGTLIRKKGVLELAYIFNLVFKQNPKAELILIGKDDFDRKTGNNSTFSLMKKIFSKHALHNVKYMGKIPYQELSNQIKKAHICVFPSLAESFGMVTIEAMAMQKAVVSTNYNWAKEIIDNNNDGILEDPKNHLEFSNKICALLSDEKFNQEIAVNARKKIEKKFDIQIITNKNIKFYKSLIRN